jgi:hypothetical protein
MLSASPPPKWERRRLYVEPGLFYQMPQGVEDGMQMLNGSMCQVKEMDQ